MFYLPEVVACQKAEGGSPVITLFEVEMRDYSCDGFYYLGDADVRQVPLLQGFDGICLREAPSRSWKGWQCHPRKCFPQASLISSVDE